MSETHTCRPAISKLASAIFFFISGVHGDRTPIGRKENTSPERQIATNLLHSGVGTRASNGEQDPYFNGATTGS